MLRTQNDKFGRQGMASNATIVALAALSSEVLLMTRYLLPFSSAGTQRTTTIILGTWTPLILQLISVVGFAPHAAHNSIFDQIVTFTAGMSSRSRSF